MSPTLYAAHADTATDTLLVLAHGAGAGQKHPFMVRYALGLAARGIDVVTFDFPYMEAKRRTPDKAPVLEEAFRQAIREACRDRDTRATRLVIGGKSMGGRMATHLAAAPETWPSDLPSLSGVVALGYPLKPPGGARGQDRVSHLVKITVPVLIVQGTRDSFGGPADVQAALGAAAPHVSIHAVEGADHSFAVPKALGKAQARVDEEICDAVSSWTARLRRPNGA
jgi:predicted alpha/beta-hydrolase family hydrolase